jgi:hypothetical protein
MTDEERARRDAALKELDKLSAAYAAAEKKLDAARDALHDSIIKHLKERNARPGEVSDHTPYDRNHIRRIANAAGVPPLRERTVRSAKGDLPPQERAPWRPLIRHAYKVTSRRHAPR